MENTGDAGSQMGQPSRIKDDDEELEEGSESELDDEDENDESSVDNKEGE